MPIACDIPLEHTTPELPPRVERFSEYRKVAEVISLQLKRLQQSQPSVLETTFSIQVSPTVITTSTLISAAYMPLWTMSRENGCLIYSELRPYLQQEICLPDACFAHCVFYKWHAFDARRLTWKEAAEMADDNCNIRWYFHLNTKLAAASRVEQSSSHVEAKPFVEDLVSEQCFPGTNPDLSRLVASYVTDMEVGCPHFVCPEPPAKRRKL